MMSEAWSIKVDGEIVTFEARTNGWADLAVSSINGGAWIKLTRDELVALVQLATTALEVMDRKGWWNQ